MKTSDFLFPRRLTRRDFIKMTAAASSAVAATCIHAVEESTTPVRLGSGSNTYEAVPGWGQLPPGMKYGFGCGIVVDSKDRVYVTSRSTNPCVAILERDGQLVETWSNDFADKVGYTPE